MGNILSCFSYAQKQPPEHTGRMLATRATQKIAAPPRTAADEPCVPLAFTLQPPTQGLSAQAGPESIPSAVADPGSLAELPEELLLDIFDTLAAVDLCTTPMFSVGAKRFIGLSVLRTRKNSIGSLMRQFSGHYIPRLWWPSAASEPAGLLGTPCGRQNWISRWPASCLQDAVAGHRDSLQSRCRRCTTMVGGC